MTLSPVALSAAGESPLTSLEAIATQTVMRAVRRGSRVLLAGNWPELRTSLEAADCEVTELPVDVPAAAGLLARSTADTLLVTRDYAPSFCASLLDTIPECSHLRDVIIVFRNLSASLFVEMVGATPPPRNALPERWVRQQLGAAGLSITGRHAWSTGTSATSLALDAERALKRLVVQLEPSAEADHVTLVASRSAAPLRKASLVPGLVSIVVRSHSTKRLPLLDHALFSLAGQRHHPLEIVLATQAPEERARERFEGLLRRHQAYGKFDYQIIEHPSATDARARLANLGVEAARGQYLGFLDDDDVVYPDHYERLVKALTSRDAAWAFAPVRRAWLTRDPHGNLYCTRKDVYPSSDRWDLLAFLRDNYITCHSYLIDRTRVGGFRIAFAEELTKNEDYVLLLRLAALFRPIALGGHPTCEYRIRDDGTNSILAAARSDQEAQILHAEWALANAMKDGLKNPLQMLITEGELQRMTATLPRASDAGDALRHRVMDVGNALLKTRAPRLHRFLKRAALQVVRRM